MTSKHQIAKAVSEMAQAITGLIFALADHEPQYWRVYDVQIENALRRLREAEASLVEAKVLAKQEAPAAAETA